MRLGRFHEALDLSSAAESVARSIDDGELLSDALRVRALVVRLQGDLDLAAELTTQALHVARRAGHKIGVAMLIQGMGTINRLAGRWAPAERQLREAHDLWVEYGEPQGILSCLYNLAVLSVFQGRHLQGKRLYEEVLEVSRELGDRTGLADASNGLGEIARLHGDFDAAEARYRQAERLYRSVGSSQWYIPSLNMIPVLLARGDVEAAAEAARQTRAILELRGGRGLIAFTDAALMQCAARMADTELFEACAQDLEGFLASGLPLASDLWRDVTALAIGAAEHAERGGSAAMAKRARALADRIETGPT